MTANALVDPFGLVGTTLDAEHRVDKIIGEGGFGVVYRGWHLPLEQPIAIKALKVMGQIDERSVQDALFAKFREEAKLLYTLSQSSLHIVRSIDFGAVTTPTGHWAPYMVLEWLEGRSLSDDLEDRRRRGLRGRTLEETLAILGSAAEGLGVAHKQRVAHRDVKPGNFFLLRDQQLKVLDFGIAKILRDGDEGGTKSPFSSFTWLYAAPEQLDPRVGQTGLATDVYSFALVLTEMLTDRSPSDGHDVVSLLKASTDPTIRPTPRQRGAQVPDNVEVVCRRALAVDPKARFQSMAELWTALTAAAQGRPVEVGRTSSPSMDPNGARVSSGLPQTGQPHRSSMVGPPTPPVHLLQGQAPMTGMPMTAMPHSPVPPTQPSAYAPQIATTVPYGPGPVGPPPGMMARPRPVAPPRPSSAPMIVAILAIILGLLFVATCAGIHAACR